MPPRKSQSRGDQGGGPSRTLWEYEEDFALHDTDWAKLLNHYGSQGWELVAVIHDESTSDPLQSRLVFKRPKQLETDGE